MSPDQHSGLGRLARAVEVVAYAPLGLGALLRESAPAVLEIAIARGRAEADRRREELERRVTTVRSTGQVAVHFGLPALTRGWRSRAGRGLADAGARVARLATTATSSRTPFVAERLGGLRLADHEPSPSPSRPGPAPGVSGGGPASELAAASGADPVTRRDESAHLPIPGYDALSASQVVERLAGLSVPELEAVADYEARNRARRTILGKIDQLRADPAGEAPTPSAAATAT